MAGIDKALKSFKQEVTTKNSSVAVGKCKISFLPRSVSKNTNITFSLGIKVSQKLEGHIQATCTLSCNPPLQLQKPCHIQIPTWFWSDESLDVKVCRNVDSSWEEVDQCVLTDEGVIDIHTKQLDNFSVFLPLEFLKNVKVKVCPCVYNHHGNTVSSVILDDEVVREFYLRNITKNKFPSFTEEAKQLSAALGDVIQFSVCGDQKMSVQRAKGEVKIDEMFFEELKSSLVDLEAVPFPTTCRVRQIRSGSEVIAEDDYSFDLGAGRPGMTSINFLGNVQADNHLAHVNNLRIDQRTVIDDAGGERLEKDLVSFGDNTDVAKFFKDLPNFNFATGPSECGAQINFCGNIKAKNMIYSVDTAVIDQRKIRRKHESPSGTQPQQVEGDVPFPTQVNQGDSHDDDESKDLETDSPSVKLAGSDRIFSDPKVKDNQGETMEVDLQKEK